MGGARTIRLAAASALSLAVVAGPGAPGASVHGALSESYSVTAPTPMPVLSAQGGCTVGAEGVHKNSHPFRVPKTGTLTFRVGNYTGDWDAAIIDDESQVILDYAAHQATYPVETVTATLAPNQAVTLVACNFSGGPTANASFDFVPVQGPQLSVSDVVVAEGDGGSRAAVFTVALSEPIDSLVNVSYLTEEASASEGADYAPKTGTVSIPAGSTSATVKIAVSGDADDEGDETFVVRLFQPLRGGIADPTGVATIVDDDPGTGRRLAVGDVVVFEGDAGTHPAVFTVSLSAPSASTVTVSYATANGSAGKLDDYAAKFGTLSFAPGTTSATVKVAARGDTTVEGDEAFTLKLSGASGATIADAVGTGTVANDDL